MRFYKWIGLLIGLFTIVPLAWGADPYIGYLYPAGGQQGTVVRMLIAGQRLKGVDGAFITGSGVHATILSYEGPNGPLNRVQQQELRRRVDDILAERGARKLPGKTKPKTAVPAPTVPPAPVTPSVAPFVPETPPAVTPPPSTPAVNPATPAAPPAGTPAILVPPPAVTSPPVTLPDLPDLRDLEQKTSQQLRQLVEKYTNQSRRPKPPMAETVTLEVTIDADAAPGDREFRLRTRAGLSNVRIFQVGQLPELLPPAPAEMASPQPVTEPLQPAPTPVVLNGRILPGQVATFPLHLRKGQQLAFVTRARYLIPFLADAVPGWFQAVLSLEDADGKQLAYADHFRVDPDPVFVLQVPADGDYRLKIRDSLYRGRQDFVYRIIIDDVGHFAALDGGASNAVTDHALAYRQFTHQPLPEITLPQPHHTPASALPITLPQIVQGCIRRAGEVDVVKFSGKAGDTVVAEVYARRLGSSLDSLLKLSDAAGHIIAWNDDNEDKVWGLIPAQTDSYLTVKLPAAGVYYLQVSDTQGHGGEDNTYALRVSAPLANFALYSTPSCLNIPAGRTTTFTVYASRKDGWDGDILLALQNPPAGFILTNAKIPAGQDHATITLRAPNLRYEQPLEIHLLGSALIDGNTVSRPVLPSDQMMQAFAYQHLVPAQELLVMVIGGRAGNKQK